ncbi:MAG: zinc-ribbon domain-containing protein [Candidatus Helarchaeota archaeon]|nr:zinc-ribbon domain-containing protein [Candidatus Helarchaeota archaeon]
MKKSTIKEMQEIARYRGGKCLSTEYINSRTKLEWRCKKGHKWEARPDTIKHGHWCPECGSEKLTIKEMQEIAKRNGGKCLSTEYINSHTKLDWQCIERHEWKATPANIKSGKWCPKCANKRKGIYHKLTIEEMQEIARQSGGKCISPQYFNVETNLEWQCKEGHQWKARPDHIKEGSWCPKCANLKKLTIEEMQEIAKQRGGKCLSNEYINNRTKLEWQCKKGHIWEAQPYSIKCGTWCPECRIRINERISRELFETILNDKFPKSRPKWLINERGNQMELDGYNKELALAFEYQGIQHYKYVKYFHKSRNDFERRKADDEAKRKLCKMNGVTLVEIPYTISNNKIQNYIIKKCKEKNVTVPKSNKKINYKKLILCFDE